MWVLAAIVVVVWLCLMDVSCSSRKEDNHNYVQVMGELGEMQRVNRELRAEELARTARDLRRLAGKYRKAGQDKEADEAIAAAEEIDRRLKKARP